MIAPRAPARGAQVTALASADHNVAQRSKQQAITRDTQVYVADTIGEMGLWYRLARVAMVGGTWASVGGHNPYEPASLGCLVLHGPNVWNFSESFEELTRLAPGSCIEVANDAPTIAEAVRAAWSDPRPAQAITPISAQAQSLLDQLEVLAEAFSEQQSAPGRPDRRRAGRP
jgi:3-deoxy-D-manno-octulosonic-acid transferase